MSLSRAAVLDWTPGPAAGAAHARVWQCQQMLFSRTVQDPAQGEGGENPLLAPQPHFTFTLI